MISDCCPTAGAPAALVTELSDGAPYLCLRRLKPGNDNAGTDTNVGNNTGGGINIAIELPGATGVGNCAKAACINIFGTQLL